MITPDGENLVCDAPNCEAKRKNHKWGRVKAEGWFFEKSGKVWCPDHHPDWVTEWRKKNEAAAAKEAASEESDSED
jgi:hypothetical protein